MSKIYTAETTLKIFESMSDAEMSNNGYSPLKYNEKEVIEGLELAGYKVQSRKNVFGDSVLYVYTPKSIECGFEYFPKEKTKEKKYFDCESALLSRAERMTMDY